MADGRKRVGAAADGSGERRIHEDEAWTGQIGHCAADRRPVVAGNLGTGEGSGKPRAPGRVDLIEVQSSHPR